MLRQRTGTVTESDGSSCDSPARPACGSLSQARQSPGALPRTVLRREHSGLVQARRLGREDGQLESESVSAGQVDLSPETRAPLLYLVPQRQRVTVTVARGLGAQGVRGAGKSRPGRGLTWNLKYQILRQRTCVEDSDQ